jgi:excisionase family DNA binding protein
MPRQLESIDAAAQRLSVNPRTIRRAIADGRVTGYRVGTKTIRVDTAEIDNELLQPIPAASAS